MLRSKFLLSVVLAAFSFPALSQVHAPPESAGPLPPEPVELWPGAITGMTPEEMADAFPEAERVAGDTLGNGLIERLRITPYDLSGVNYAVKFFFDARHFRQVLLSLEKAERDVKATTAECDRRTAALKADYGEPAKANIAIEGTMDLNRSYRFETEETEVILLCLASQYGTSIVNVAISPRED